MPARARARDRAARARTISVAPRATGPPNSPIINLTLTVSVYEGVVVVVSAYVRLQRRIREGGRRPVPVTHNSHLQHSGETRYNTAQ